MKRRIKKLVEIGLINTLRLNLHYFGKKGLLHPVIMASKHVKIHCLRGEVIAKNPSRFAVQLGFGYVGTVDKKYRRTLWENSGTIIFEGKANLGLGTKIACSGRLTIGDNVSFNANSDIICRKEITIGEGSLISWECLIMDSDFLSIYAMDNQERLNPDKPIHIGNRVWCGCRTTVLKGAVLPDDTVVAACSTITKAMTENNAVYGSNKVIKRDVFWRSD